MNLYFNFFVNLILFIIKMDLVLFPNQLFHPDVLKSIIPNIRNIYFIEDPVFYGDRKGNENKVNKLNINKLRIIFNRILHNRYVTFLSETYSVEYITIDTLWNKIDYSFLPNECLMIDPCDHLLMKRLRKTTIKWTIFDNPSFIFTNKELEKYMEGKENKHLQHNQFYKKSKDKLNILKDVPSQDIYNRNQYSKDIKYPEDPYRFKFSSETEWIDAVEWLNGTPFKNNIGPSELWDTIIKNYLVHLPVSHTDTLKWLDDFILNRLHTYGKYQDVVIPSNPLLYHSGLSIYLNNGMITPLEIVNKVINQNTSIQNIEGFIRQVIGWREYCRLYYLYVPAKIYRKNIFNQPKRVLANKWYNGKTKIPVVDETIKAAFNYGYINHIQRLMIMSNYMTLNNIHPDNVYKWMYEFSLDSYDWVMIFNCYSMGTWSDKGYAMRKPYISKSNYVLKMSDSKKGEWEDIWNNRFNEFIHKNEEIIKHTQLANLLKK